MKIGFHRTLKTSYKSKPKSCLLHYENGKLKTIAIVNLDMVLFDGLKHEIKMYEEDLNTDLFTKQD